MGFGVKHFCSVAFEGAPKEFYQITIEPGRTKSGTSNDSYFFSSLPPWWSLPAAKVTTPIARPEPKSATRTFPLRHRLARNAEFQMRQLLQGRPGHEARPSADDKEITVAWSPVGGAPVFSDGRWVQSLSADTNGQRFFTLQAP